MSLAEDFRKYTLNIHKHLNGMISKASEPLEEKWNDRENVSIDLAINKNKSRVFLSESLGAEFSIVITKTYFLAVYKNYRRIDDPNDVVWW